MTDIAAQLDPIEHDFLAWVNARHDTRFLDAQAYVALSTEYVATTRAKGQFAPAILGIWHNRSTDMPF